MFFSTGSISHSSCLGYLPAWRNLSSILTDWRKGHPDKSILLRIHLAIFWNGIPDGEMTRGTLPSYPTWDTIQITSGWLQKGHGGGAAPRLLCPVTGQDYFYGVHGVAKDTHLGLHWATKAADAGDRCGDGLEGFVGRSVTMAIMRCNIILMYNDSRY